MTEDAMDFPDDPRESAPEEKPENRPAPQGRLVSVDALRGFDMFWIIGGHGFAWALADLFYGEVPPWLAYQLHHPKWTGFSAWDMIMPLFLFVVGVAMPFSFAKRVAEGKTTLELHVKIAMRTIVLFVLGMVAQGHLLDFDLSKLHVFCNTLQAIAVGYCVAALLLIHTGIRVQVAVTAGVLLVFWAVLMLVPSPDPQTGELVAGALKEQHNIALHIDKMLLGSFEDGTTYTWILSSLGFVGSVMLGVFGGQLLRTGIPGLAKAAWLLVMGFACLGVAWLWNDYLPIIKHIWTSSMVLWAGGFCFLLLAVFYLVIDVIGFRVWAFPFKVIGMNAIFVYMVANVIGFSAISNPIIGGVARNLAGSETFGEPGAAALRSFASLLVAWLILWFLYRKKTFLRI